LPGAAHAVRRSQGTSLELHALSRTEFGPLSQIRIYGQRPGETRESLLSDRTLREFEFHQRLEIPAGLLYARAELETASGFSALTDAVEPG
jgi:hypothetical protein